LWISLGITKFKNLPQKFHGTYVYGNVCTIIKRITIKKGNKKWFLGISTVLLNQIQNFIDGTYMDNDKERYMFVK